MNDPDDRDRWWAVWIAVCGLVSLAMFGLMAWAVIVLVRWVTTQ